jgi:hypothetical protein
MGFRVQGSGFGVLVPGAFLCGPVHGSRLKVQGSGFRVQVPGAFLCGPVALLDLGSPLRATPRLGRRSLAHLNSNLCLGSWG